MSRSLAILKLLVSSLYEGALAPEHRADLAGSGLAPDTVQAHRFRAVPPNLIGPLLGWTEAGLTRIRSALLVPYPMPEGGWMPHVRIKVFPPYTDATGHAVKYLQPRGRSPRLYFTLAHLPTILHGEAPLWLVEGEKKALAVAQLGLPAVGFAGIHAWHVGRSSRLLPDFNVISLWGRTVELVPDGDVQTNPHVRRGAEGLARALALRGARPRLVRLPRRRVA